MKKLFGVMILAGFPVACGSTLPSGPDAVQTAATSQDATVESQAKGPRPAPRPTPAPLPPTCDETGQDIVGIDGIQIAILSEGDGEVTLRADAVISDSDRMTPCFVPTWSVDPADRGIRLTTSRDPQIVTLFAPAGKYTVQARLNAADRRVVGRLKVVVR